MTAEYIRRNDAIIDIAPTIIPARKEGECRVKRPPQSWMYVELGGQNDNHRTD